MDFPIDMLLLLLSYLILLFQILNRSHYFEKKNIHSIILIRLCSKGKLLFVLGSLLWSISIICTTDWTISHWIGFGLVVMCYIVEYNFYGIPLEPINYPKFIDVGQGQVIREEIVEYIVDQPVIGIILEEETRAYSTESLARCHVVNDECGRYKYAVCWCVFSQFGMVWNRVVAGQERIFKALTSTYKTHSIISDQFGNLWLQTTGEGLYGEDALAHPLEPLDRPMQVMWWGQWKDSNPLTKLMNHRYVEYSPVQDNDEASWVDTHGIGGGYYRAPQNLIQWYYRDVDFHRDNSIVDTYFPPRGDNPAEDLPLKTLSMLIMVGNTCVVMPSLRMADYGCYRNIVVEGKRIFFYYDSQSQMYGAFENPKIGGEYLSLISVLEGEHEYSNGITAIYDELTKKDKKWDFKGKVLEGTTEDLVPLRRVYWLVWWISIFSYFPPDRIMLLPAIEVEYVIGKTANQQQINPNNNNNNNQTSGKRRKDKRRTPREQ